MTHHPGFAPDFFRFWPIQIATLPYQVIFPNVSPKLT